MSSISKINCVVPEHKLWQKDLRNVLEGWGGLDSSSRNKIVSLSDRVGVDKRNFIISPSQVLELQGLSQRAKIFEELGLNLLKEAVDKVIDDTVDKKQIDNIIVTSCSVPIIPALDSEIIQYLNLSPNITRLPVFQYGCAGGVFSLGMANKLAKLGKSVLVLSIELCSLVFQSSNNSIASLIGTSLFADGACALLVEPEEKENTLSIVDWQSYLVPESRSIMGYDLKDDGLHLRLDQSLPNTLVSSFPNLVNQLLSKHDLQANDISAWLFHPGSVKIVEMLRDSMNLKQEQVKYAAEVLSENGNMSSATILFVVNHFLKTGDYKKGDNVIVAGVGPGLTVELVLLKVC